jgi:hypothetical protein
MKLLVRILAVALVATAAVAGNTLPKRATQASFHSAAMPAGAANPMCNPFYEKCTPIR